MNFWRTGRDLKGEKNLYEAAKRGLRLEAQDIIMPKNVKSQRKGTPIGFRC